MLSTIWHKVRASEYLVGLPFSSPTDAPSFLDEIRNIAVNKKNLSAGTVAKMKQAPVLLCSQRKVISQSAHKTTGDELDDEEWEMGYDLKAAEQIVIVDDTSTHQVFGAELFTAPQEDIIEGEFFLM